jgi:hypothetical protein
MYRNINNNLHLISKHSFSIYLKLRTDLFNFKF